MGLFNSNTLAGPQTVAGMNKYLKVLQTSICPVCGSRGSSLEVVLTSMKLFVL